MRTVQYIIDTRLCAAAPLATLEIQQRMTQPRATSRDSESPSLDVGFRVLYCAMMSRGERARE